MKQLLELCKRIFRRNGYSTAALDLTQAMAVSKRPDEDTWKPEKLTDEHQLMVLRRVWFRINPELPVPKEEKVLFGLEPSGLTEEEKNAWYYGARAEAAHRYLEIFNHSWSKTKLRENLEAECLGDVLELFDKETRDRIINEGIKYRSD